MSGGRRWSRSRPLAALAIGVVVFLAVTAVRYTGLLQPLELDVYDRFLRLRTPIPAEGSPIVLIRIQEEDIRRFGYPINDAVLDAALERLLASEARAVGVDLYRDTPVPQAYQGFAIGGPPPREFLELGATVTRTNRIVMIVKFPGVPGAGTAPPAWLEGTNQVAFGDVPVDPGGIVRRSLLYLWDGDQAFLSLALQLAARYLQAEGVGIQSDAANPDHVRIGATTVPPLEANDGSYVRADARGYQFLMDYRLGSASFPSFSLGELISNQVPGSAVRDKVVIVGTTAASVKDHFYTPYSQARRADQEMYGIDVHAHAVSQLIRFGRGESRPMSTLGEFTEVGWILLWSLLGAALGLWNRSYRWSVLMGGAGLGLLVVGGYLLFARDWWLPVVPPALAGLGSAGLGTALMVVLERTERREVTRLFSRFLRPKVAEEIWRQRDEFMRGDQLGRPRSRWATLSTLMLDMEGYTAVSEKTDPYALMGWVNEFASAVAKVIERHDGVVDDYAGDGIKANFGFPVPSSGAQVDVDAANAVYCALAIGDEMERLNARWAKRRLPVGRVRIGVFTGPSVVGVLGSDQSLKYTSVGDTVNIASRLESFDKDGYGSDPEAAAWRILIGVETLNRVGGQFRTTDLGWHVFKGKQEAVHVYRVDGRSKADETAEVQVR